LTARLIFCAAAKSSTGSGGSGGDHPQAAEILTTFSERCPDAIVINKQEKAD
jgi:hypothetical protein